MRWSEGRGGGQSKAGVHRPGLVCQVGSWGFIMTFEVLLHKKKSNILYDHIGVKMNTVQVGLLHSRVSSDFKRNESTLMCFMDKQAWRPGGRRGFQQTCWELAGDGTEAGVGTKRNLSG